MTFETLKIIEPIRKALISEGYTKATPIQQKAIPVLLEGKDLLGCAQTGTGKTAAFAVPILQILKSEENKSGKERRKIRSLVLTPTRELAIQIGESFTAYGRHTGLRNTVIFGGVSQKPQTDALASGTDILIATPGRLLDLMNQRLIDLKDVSLFVLDEADRMLDMGFIHDVNRVISKLPKKRQTMLFSATMPPEIRKLSEKILFNPENVAVTPVSSTVDIIQQELYFVDKPNKKSLLIHVLQSKDIQTALVFTRTKHGANKVAKDLIKAGISAEAIHGNKSQNARQTALANFKARRTRVLVATDIAARGIDIEGLSHVINFEISNMPETYVHRIGRTGRAGAAGTAISFCDREEKQYIKGITKLISKEIPVVQDHPFPFGKSNTIETPSVSELIPDVSAVPVRSKAKPARRNATRENNRRPKERGDKAGTVNAAAHNATEGKSVGAKAIGNKARGDKARGDKAGVWSNDGGVKDGGVKDGGVKARVWTNGRGVKDGSAKTVGDNTRKATRTDKTGVNKAAPAGGTVKSSAGRTPQGQASSEKTKKKGWMGFFGKRSKGKGRG